MEDFPRSSFCSGDFALGEIKCARNNETAADQYRRGALRVSGIRIPEVLCISVEFGWSKNPTGCSPGNSPLCRNPNTAGATLWNTPPPKNSRTPQEEPHFVALSDGATSCGNSAPERSSCGLFPPHWSKLLCGKSSS
jgi:hypothetical protein